MKRIVLLVVVLLLLFSSALAITAEREVMGTVKAGEAVEILIHLDLVGEEPSSIIVTEEIPAGWSIESSEPKATKFDGKVKWLLYGDFLKDGTTIKYSLMAPLDFSGAAGLVGTWATLETSGLIGGDFSISETAPSTASGNVIGGEPEQPDYTLIIMGGIALIVIAIIAAAFIMRGKKK
ncbi:MAG: hypothetical protein ABID38_02950 [Candidatus Diapherotrites archaeon]